LLGYETWSEEAHAPVVVVEHAIPAKHTSGTPVRLTFTKESWRDLDGITEKLSQNGRVPTRVGWYHSHPNISIFLSHWDLDVCKEFDRRQYPIALVVDPVNRQGGFFIRGKNGYHPHVVQGFLEVHDVQKDSIVDWSNLARGEKESVLISGRRKEAAPSDVANPLQLQRQVEELCNRLNRVSSKSRLLLALTILVAASLTATSWYVLDRSIGRESAMLQQQSARLQAQVNEFVKVLVDLEATQASRSQPPNDPDKDLTPSFTSGLTVPDKPGIKGPTKAQKHGTRISIDSAEKRDKSKGKDKDKGGNKDNEKGGDKDKGTKPASAVAADNLHVDHSTTGSPASTPTDSATPTTPPAKGDVFPDATKVAPSHVKEQPTTDSGVKPPAPAVKPGDDSKSGDTNSKPTNTDPKKSTEAPVEGSPPGVSFDRHPRARTSV